MFEVCGIIDILLHVNVNTVFLSFRVFDSPCQDEVHKIQMRAVC